MRAGNWTVLETTEAVSRALLLFESDGKNFVVYNAANKFVWNDSLLCIGPLIYSNVTLDTENVNPRISLKTDPIRIAWEDDNGETLAYEFKDVLYNPSSPFNIFSVGRVGHLFGSIDSPPTNNEEGTWVKCYASYTDFTWDHSRFTRRFAHSSDGLP